MYSQIGGTVYDQSPLTQAFGAEFNAATNTYDAARTPAQTGVIAGLGFNQNILNQVDMADPRNHAPPSQTGMVISELTGQPIAQRDFHQNQVPFIARSTQNINSHTYDTKLEHFTGTSQVLRPKKQEVPSFFDTRPDAGSFVYGSPSFTSHGFENRFHASKYRQGEKPFQDVHVGPGLNAGLDPRGTGGFQQANTLEFVRAAANRTINNRLPNNPRITYNLPLNPGALPGGTRGLQAPVKKQRPEKWYRNTPDRYFVTVGAVTGSTLREKVNAKATRRQNHKSYYGGIGTASNLRQKKDPSVRKSRRNNYMADSIRNAYRGDSWTVNEDANENAVGDYGLTSIENRPNERDVTQLREHRLNLTSNVKKLVAPFTDLFRKTRKENVIGNIRPEGNMGVQMPSKLTVHDPEDIARTTRKELNIHNEHDGFLKGPEKSQVWDPNDIARTTIKEMNIHNKAPYINLAPQQPNSLRVYDPEDIARTTVKELTEDNNHPGFVQMPDEYIPGGYISTNVTMRNTHKQFTSDYYYTGTPDGEVGKGTGRGYLAANYKARNTHKQFISDYEYSGSAGFYQPNQRSYSAEYAQRLNPNKQEIALGRAPTQTGVKLNAGGDMVNIKFDKLESDQINIREPSETYVYSAPPQKNFCGTTTVKQSLPEQVQRARLDPDILDAFRANPYTQSLQSAA